MPEDTETPRERPRVVILGGGPAGVGAAYQLRRHDRADVTLVERNPVFGGNAGSFVANGQHLDYGSHRLHSACDPRILEDIRRLLKGDLAHRVRHGRIRLRGKWLHFPLKPVDLLLRLDKTFAAGAAWDMARRALPRGENAGDTFASVLRANLGATICEHFYFPYARKIWGREPEELSGIQARKRVTAGTFRKLVRRLAKPPGAGKFHYPRRGYGQISDGYAEAATEAGADLWLGWRATGLIEPEAGAGRWRVQAEGPDGESRTVEADHLWSTIPVTIAARMISPEPPAEVIDAIGRIRYRAMVLVYLELGVDRFSSTDAHYFPESHIAMTRLSEPKNYYGVAEPVGRTTLCAELPCAVGDDTWNMSDEDLGRWVAEDMARAGLPLPSPPLSAFSRRLPQAYPVYLQGYEEPLGVVDEWVSTRPGFLSYGRQGLFAHDNTHHALYMAYAAVECLGERGFDHEKWTAFREIFSTHVVED